TSRVSQMSRKTTLRLKLRPLRPMRQNRHPLLQPPVRWVLSFQLHTLVSAPLMSGVARAQAVGTALVLLRGRTLRPVLTFRRAPQRSWGPDSLLGPPVHSPVTLYFKTVDLT